MARKFLTLGLGYALRDDLVVVWKQMEQMHQAQFERDDKIDALETKVEQQKTKIEALELAVKKLLKGQHPEL